MILTKIAVLEITHDVDWLQKNPFIYYNRLMAWNFQSDPRTSYIFVLAFRYLIRGAFSIYVCAFKILLFSVYYVYIRRK